MKTTGWWFCQGCEAANVSVADSCAVCEIPCESPTPTPTLRGDLVRRAAARYPAVVVAAPLSVAPPTVRSSLRRWTRTRTRRSWWQERVAEMRSLYTSWTNVLRNIVRALS